MKNFGMKEPKQYIASKDRPRHGTRFLSALLSYIVMLSASETSLDIASSAESKMI
jgi:hypothetical protein